MIYGIGVDLVQLPRIEAARARHGERFDERILHPAERERLPADPRKRDLALAKAFAVKEAFAKALGTGFREGVAHDDVGSTRGALGKPELVCSDRLQARLRDLGIVRTHLSITDEREYVCAMVVLETAG